jgi:hypothetical protein
MTSVIAFFQRGRAIDLVPTLCVGMQTDLTYETARTQVQGAPTFNVGARKKPTRLLRA